MQPWDWLRLRRSAFYPFLSNLKGETHVIDPICTGLDNNTIPLSSCLCCSHLLNLRSITVAVLLESPAKQCESPYLSIPAPTTNNFKADIQTKMSSVMGFQKKVPSSSIFLHKDVGSPHTLHYCRKSIMLGVITACTIWPPQTGFFWTLI